MTHTIKPFQQALTILLWVAFCFALQAKAQSTAFTYQGKLTDSGNPATGNYDLQFKLFDTVTVGTGTQQGSTITVSGVSVSSGVFAVQLDFGASVFTGASRYLEIGVRPAGNTDPYVILSPRQMLSSSPYAIHTLSATAADSLSAACVGCVSDAHIQSIDGAKITGSIAGSQISGTVPVNSVPTGSGNYIQNAATLQKAGKNSIQQAASFNIDGDGVIGGTLTANEISTLTKYTIGGEPILSSPTPDNLFVGIFSGTNNTGFENSFFGFQAGITNTSGNRNSFFGVSSGLLNTTGGNNAFFGYQSGNSNNQGVGNAFFGYQSGVANTTGNQNAAFGTLAGKQNTIGNFNSYFGYQAGTNATSGISNTFVGSFTAFSFSSGNGNNNTLLGADSLVNFGINYATAIGSGAYVAQSNSIVLGREDVNQTSLDSVGIGIPRPARTLDVSGRARIRNIPLEASTAAVCFNSIGDLLQCGASSLRWKRNIRLFRSGLEVIRRLLPISFIWKEDGRADFGLGAEEVAKVAPNLVFTNKAGEVEGVKYEKLDLLLINAVKEQQQQIESQQRQIRRQQREIIQLKMAVCAVKPKSKVCR